MSVSGELRFVLLKYFTDGDAEGAGDLEKLQADSLINGYAHELAERQRAFDGPSMTMAGNRMVPLDLITAVIDPEASSNG